jgi:hypothetical protein
MHSTRKAGTCATTVKNGIENLEAGSDQIGKLVYAENRSFDAIHIPDHVDGDVGLEIICILSVNIAASLTANMIQQIRVERRNGKNALDLDGPGKSLTS